MEDYTDLCNMLGLHEISTQHQMSESSLQNGCLTQYGQQQEDAHMFDPDDILDILGGGEGFPCSADSQTGRGDISLEDLAELPAGLGETITDIGHLLTGKRTALPFQADLMLGSDERQCHVARHSDVMQVTKIAAVASHPSSRQTNSLMMTMKDAENEGMPATAEFQSEQLPVAAARLCDLVQNTVGTQNDQLRALIEAVASVRHQHKDGPLVDVKPQDGEAERTKEPTHRTCIIQKRDLPLDFLDLEPDSGVESLNSLSPQDSLGSHPPSPSPPPPPMAMSFPPVSPTEFSASLVSSASALNHDDLPLTSVLCDPLFAVPPSVLTVQPADCSVGLSEPYVTAEVTVTDGLEANSPHSSQLVFEPSPSCVTNKDKYNGSNSLLSSILSIPPVETESSRLLTSFLSQQSPLSASSLSLLLSNNKSSVNEESPLQLPQRKKLVISSRKREHMSPQGEILTTGGDSSSNAGSAGAWDQDLRLQAVNPSVTQSVLVCQTCGSRHRDRQALEAHRRSHARLHLCPTCGLSFPSLAARTAHRRQLHQRHHLCPTCNRAFSTSQKLERHARTHADAKDFKCETCSKRFSSEENMRMHTKVHLGQKDFTCVVCKREYFTKSGLNHHMKQAHADDRLVKCSKCEFLGRSMADVEQHYLAEHSLGAQQVCAGQEQAGEDAAHLLDQDVACPICPNRCKSHTKLNNLTKQHSLNKVHHCQHCGQRFAFKNSLTKHLSKGRCVILKKSQLVPNSLQVSAQCQSSGPCL